MISYFQNKKNKGMTYIELIVVLGIFAAFSAVSIVNYRQFQSKIYIKTLANDIALKIVEAQKNSTSGKWNTGAPSDAWKPSYGLHFNLSSDNKSFKSFADLNQDKSYVIGELLDTFNVTKGNSISEIRIFPSDSTVNDLTLTFTRPSGGAYFVSGGSPLANVSYVQISITSPQGATNSIKLYSSGRIQLN